MWTTVTFTIHVLCVYVTWPTTTASINIAFLSLTVNISQ